MGDAKKPTAAIVIKADITSPIGISVTAKVFDKDHEPTVQLIATISRMLTRAAQMSIDGAVEQAERETKQ